MTNHTDYWTECLAQSLEEHGVPASPDQIANIASDVEVSHDNYGMAFGHDAIPNPVQTELDQTKVARNASSRYIGWKDKAMTNHLDPTALAAARALPHATLAERIVAYHAALPVGEYAELVARLRDAAQALIAEMADEKE